MDFRAILTKSCRLKFFENVTKAYISGIERKTNKIPEVASMVDIFMSPLVIKTGEPVNLTLRILAFVKVTKVPIEKKEVAKTPKNMGT